MFGHRIPRSNITLARLVLRVALVFAVMLWAVAMPLSAQVANQQCTQEKDQQTTSGASGTLTFQDQCGTRVNTFEMKVTGSPSAVAVTIYGCMRGTTCTALTSSTSTVNTNLTTTGGPYDNYQISFSLTGGTSPTLIFNRTGSPGSVATSNPLLDTRTDTGPLKANACGRIQDLSTNSTVVDARGDQNAAVWPCAAVDFDPLNPNSHNTVLFGSGNGALASAYSTDLGFHIGAFDIFQGNATTLVSSSGASPLPNGTLFIPDSVFPGNTFTMTGTSGNGYAALTSAAATADTVLISPGTRFLVAGSALVYRVLACNGQGGSYCYNPVNVPTGQCASGLCYSQYYTIAPSSTIPSGASNFTFTPALNISPSGAAVTFLAPVVTIGDATGLNVATQAGSLCGNCNTALTAAQVNDISVAGGGAQGQCMGGLELFGQENSFFRDFYVTSCAIGLVIEGAAPGGASTVNSGTYTRININYASLFASQWGTSLPVIPMEVDGGAEEISRFTINAGNVGNAGAGAAQFIYGLLHITNAPASSYGHGGAINLHDFHIEGCNNTQCGSSTIASGAQDGILLDSANSGGAITGPVNITNYYTCTGNDSCVNAVHVASGFLGVLNLSGVNCGTGTTNIIKDDINGNTMACADNVNGTGFYYLAADGTAFTNLNCGGGASTFAKGVCINGGKLATSGHLTQTATGKFAGHCTLSGGTCTFTIGTAFTTAAVCPASKVSGTVTGILYGTVSGTTVTITDSVAGDSGVAGAVCIGDPN